MAPCSWCQRFSLACHCPYQYTHTYSWAGVFFCFLPALRPPSGSWYTGSCGFSSPLGFPTFVMGSPLRGRGKFVLDRNEGLVSPFGSGTLVGSWLDIPPLLALSLRVCCQVVLTVSLPLGYLSSLQGSSRSLVRVKCCLPGPC